MKSHYSQEKWISNCCFPAKIIEFEELVVSHCQRRSGKRMKLRRWLYMTDVPNHVGSNPARMLRHTSATANVPVLLREVCTLEYGSAMCARVHMVIPISPLWRYLWLVNGWNYRRCLTRVHGASVLSAIIECRVIPPLWAFIFAFTWIIIIIITFWSNI